MTAIKKAMMAAAGNAGGDPIYVEDVYNCQVWSGTGAELVITTGIDLSGEGGAVFIKKYSGNFARAGAVYDTARGANNDWAPNSTAGEVTQTQGLKSFSSTGFTLGTLNTVNESGSNYRFTATTFRNAPNFFHHETVTKSAATDATVDLSILTTVGAVLVKRIDATGQSTLYWHRSFDAGKLSVFNANGAQATNGDITVVGTTLTLVDAQIDDGDYVIYAWAHDTSDEGIIQCGLTTSSASADASTEYPADIPTPWEPQALLYKYADATDNYFYQDTAMGWGLTLNYRQYFVPTLTNSFGSGRGYPDPRGCYMTTSAGTTNVVYMSIRRPMKVPEAGTEIFSIDHYTGNATVGKEIGSLDYADMAWIRTYPAVTQTNTFQVFDRLRGDGERVRTGVTTAGSKNVNWLQFTSGPKLTIANDSETNPSGEVCRSYQFKRAPEFMDVVAYTGTGSAHTEAHGLTVAPELIIIKNRDAADAWAVYNSTVDETDYLVLNTTAAVVDDATFWNDTAPTSSVFTVGTNVAVNTSGEDFIAYLFATLAGVSKVGSYTADATLTTIDCGFAAGARFILIKRTDSTGDWYVYDSTRGIVAGNDPYLLVNSSAAEVTSTDYIDPDNSGFQLTAAGSSTINVNTGEYIFLAIA